MGGQARPKQDVPELPKEVVQHIYSVTDPDDEEDVVLGFEDRVRALVVCRAWKACLDFQLCPIPALYLGDLEADRRIAAWVARTQPAVKFLVLDQIDSHRTLVTLLSVMRTALEDLSLYGALHTLQDSLTAVCLFPSLRSLSLHTTSRVSEARLDVAVLQPLSTLEQLHLRHWQSVELKGTTVLPQLSSLHIGCVDSAVVDAALLSLHDLSVSEIRTLQLRGSHLRLPQLTRLSLHTVKMGAVSWPALPQLISLTAMECPLMTPAALSEIPHLTSLTLSWKRECWEAGARVLHAAPKSLCNLCFGLSTNDWSQPPPLSSVTQLTSLSCDSPAIIPYLHPLAQLQQLKFSFGTCATAITMEHSGWLCGLSNLRRLYFGRKLDRKDSATARLKQVWCEPAVEQLEGSAAADQSPQAGASAERVPSGDALPTATPVLQQPAAAVSPIHTRSVVHSELFHLSEVLETSLAMNASLEAELTAVRQEVEQARADAETYRSKLAQLTQQVQNALLPDAKPGDKACTNMSLLLRRFQSRLSNVRAAAASWKAKAKEAAAGDVEKAREEAAEQAGVADRLLASLRRRFGDDWQKGMDARSKQLRRMKASTETAAAAAAAAAATTTTAGTGLGSAHASGRTHAPAAGAHMQADC
ncbi:hypothetical protein N2152v2_009674 [Parachlorella kessleri]